MGGNTLRALASDLGYLEGCNLATGFPLPWPAPESLLLKFVAHHLWDPVKRARIRTTACRGRGGRVARSSPAGSKKPPCSQHDAPTADELVDPDPLAGLTRVLRRPLAQIRVAARSARERATTTTRKQEGGHGATFWPKLLQACGGERLVDLRDRALLLAAFASGGRRQSEVAALRVEDLVGEDPVRADPNDMASPPLPCLSSRLGRTKTTTSDEDGRLILIGRPVSALRYWLDEAQIKEGPAFPRNWTRWENDPCAAARNGSPPPSGTLWTKPTHAGTAGQFRPHAAPPSLRAQRWHQTKGAHSLVR